MVLWSLFVRNCGLLVNRHIVLRFHSKGQFELVDDTGFGSTSVGRLLHVYVALFGALSSDAVGLQSRPVAGAPPSIDVLLLESLLLLSAGCHRITVLRGRTMVNRVLQKYVNKNERKAPTHDYPDDGKKPSWDLLSEQMSSAGITDEMNGCPSFQRQHE